MITTVCVCVYVVVSAVQCICSVQTLSGPSLYRVAGICHIVCAPKFNCSWVCTVTHSYVQNVKHSCFPTFLLLWLAAWFSDNVIGRIKEVTLCWVKLVLRYLTFPGYNVFIFVQAAQGNSAWPSMHDVGRQSEWWQWLLPLPGTKW